MKSIESDPIDSPKVDYGNHVLRDGSKNPSMTLDQARKKFSREFGGSLAASTLLGAAFIAAPQVMGYKTIVGFTGAMDIGGQAWTSKGFSTDDYKLGQTLFAMTSAALTAKFAVNLTSTPNYGLNMFNAGLLGGANATADTVFTNNYYGENKDPIYSDALGFAFGSSGYSHGRYEAARLFRTSLKPEFNPKIPRLNQSYISPRADYRGNVAIGTVIGNAPSTFDLPEKK